MRERRGRTECADDRVEQASGGADNGGNPGGREDLAERPDRAADMVAEVGLVEPAAVVAHEVPHAGLRIGRVLEEASER